MPDSGWHSQSQSVTEATTLQGACPPPWGCPTGPCRAGTRQHSGRLRPCCCRKTGRPAFSSATSNTWSPPVALVTHSRWLDVVLKSGEKS